MIKELERAEERLRGMGYQGIYYNAVDNRVDPLGVSAPSWRHAVAFMFGLGFLTSTTPYDRQIRRDIMSKIGGDEFVTYLKLGVDATKSSLLDITTKKVVS